MNNIVEIKVLTCMQNTRPDKNKMYETLGLKLYLIYWVNYLPLLFVEIQVRLFVYTVRRRQPLWKIQYCMFPPIFVCRKLFILFPLETRIKNNKFERFHMQIERLNDFICRLRVTSFTCEQTGWWLCFENIRGQVN